MDKSPHLAFIDSGLGGLPYLARTRERYPRGTYSYCADNLGFPYGTKTEDQIIASFGSMVERLERHLDPDVYVVACNTASVVALAWLREHFSKPFVGVVPAVKPAAALSGNGVIGILATERTTKGSYLQGLVDTFAPHCQVIKRPATELINLIERDPFATDRATFTRLIREIRQDFLAGGADSVVLGCTHFLLFEELFVEALGQEFKIVDSRDGVARQAIKVAEDTPPREGPPVRGFWLSGPVAEDSPYPRVAEAWGLAYRGVLGG